MSAMGLCGCGCGGSTRVATKTDRGAGQVKGVPLRFITGHHNHLLRKTPYEERDCGHETPCWVWLKARNVRGYGLATPRDGGSGRVAHKVYWEKEHGSVPDGLELDHLCRRRDCVNPAHLEPVKHKENVRRGYAITHGDLSPGLGGEIKRARLAHEMSQADLADLLDCSQASVAHWERNQHRPTDSLFARLTFVLQLDPTVAEARAQRANV